MHCKYVFVSLYRVVSNSLSLRDAIVRDQGE